MSDRIYIGLMSGTSADAIDAVVVDFSAPNPKLLAHHSQTLSPDIRRTIHQLATPGHDEIDQLGGLDVQLGELFAQCALQALGKAGLNASQIQAIGSHGQTIRHRPPGSSQHPFSLQIGDPNIIAQRTGITTIADFRRRDIAAGGQGAPLVPAFHHAIFQNNSHDRVVVNIGGIANITWLPQHGDSLGFDTGPGNVLMDSWILQHQGKAYDADGTWAASGKVLDPLLKQLLLHPYFRQAYPKSTGREDFNPIWLIAQVEQHVPQSTPEDIQATLLALTAHSIANAIKGLTIEEPEVYICGGGAYNTQLMISLQALLADCPLASTASLGIAPEWIEAIAFAWLAHETLNRRSGNLRAVTGASQNVILGGVYFA